MRLFAPTLLLLAAVTIGCDCGDPAGTGGNTPPSARIASPADGATLRGLGPFELKGEGTDAEDGTLDGSRLAWSSDLDGALGTGSTLNAKLRAGTHRLSLDVTDSGGLTGRAQISVTVQTSNEAPFAVIDAPLEGEYFDEGKTIVLRGHATDPEDGKLPATALSWRSDKAGVIGTGDGVNFTGAALGPHRLLLTAVDSQGEGAQAAVNIVVVRPGTNKPPLVSIQSPKSTDQIVVGSPVTLSGTANDPEDGALSGASLTWSSSKDGALGTGSPKTLSTLTQGVHTLTLTAKDSKGLTASASVTVAVNSPNNQAPTVKITAPATGFTTYAGTSIAFTATATDPEDGALSGASVVWSSSLDGQLGTGTTLSTSALKAGTHQIRATATDSKGGQGVDTINVTVLAPNQAPVATITAPQNGATFNAGTAVQLRGSAQDPEDGALAGASLVWRSNVEGTLGTGGSVDTSALRVGQHTLTLTATDSGGRTGTATVNVTIQSAPAKIAPVARLNGSAQGEAGMALSFDGSASSDADGTIASYKFDFGDGTAPVNGSSASVTHAFAAAGTYTVTLTVTDNDGLTATATLQVTISVSVRRPEVMTSPTPGPLGSACRIAARQGTVYVLFHSEQHPSVWLGTKTSTGWTTELVDGMGFETGGVIGGRLALAVDSAGVPHVAYPKSSNCVWYATRTSGSWVRERVDSNSTLRAADDSLSLALNPAKAGQPTVVYDSTATYRRQVVAARTAPGTWTSTLVAFPNQTYSQTLSGDVLIDGAGVVYLPYVYDYSTSSAYLGAWDGTTATAVSVGSTGGGFPNWASSTWRAPGVIDLITGAGVLDVNVGSPFSATTFRLSLVEPFNTSQQAVTAYGNQPKVVVNHGTELELVTTDASGYWVRESLGQTDNARIDATMDGTSIRACFFRSGNLMLY